MRSNHYERHNKVHEKREETTTLYPTTSEDLIPRYTHPSTHASSTISLNSAFSDNIIDLEVLRKAALEKSEEYKQKIALGGALYKILGEGVVEEESFTTNWKEALDVYMRQGHDIDCENVFLKPWQTELLKCINDPTYFCKKVLPSPHASPTIQIICLSVGSLIHSSNSDCHGFKKTFSQSTSCPCLMYTSKASFQLGVNDSSSTTHSPSILYNAPPEHFQINNVAKTGIV